MSGGGKGESDPTISMLFFGAFFFGVCWLVWSIFKVQMLEFMRYVRMGEVFVLSLFVDRAHDCLHWLQVARVAPDELPPEQAYNLLTPDMFQTARACFRAENLVGLAPQDQLDYYFLSARSVGAIAEKCAPYFRWLTAAVCAGMAYYALFVTDRNKFRTIHTLESFIQVQSQVWSVIRPIVDFKPQKHSARTPGDTIPDKLPPFAEALAPEEWVAYNRIPLINGIPDREITRRAFLQQLGPRWSGIDSLPPYMLALFVCFALKGVQRREESDEMLGRVATCWHIDRGFHIPGDMMAEINKLAHDPAVGGKALEAANKHAYRTTALLGVLKWARFMGGVLAPAQFVWLRAVDRALWYPLNNLGRRSFHSEGAGALAHFMAEQAAQKALSMPRLDTAIVTLNQYLATVTPKIPSREEPDAIEGKGKKLALEGSA